MKQEWNESIFLLSGQCQNHYSFCHFKHRMLSPLAVQSSRPLFDLCFLHLCLLWAALSLSSDKNIPPFYYDGVSPFWAAAHYDELVEQLLLLLQWVVQA